MSSFRKTNTEEGKIEKGFDSSTDVDICKR
jgi:hypothetical protein